MLSEDIKRTFNIEAGLLHQYLYSWCMASLVHKQHK